MTALYLSLSAAACPHQEILWGRDEGPTKSRGGVSPSTSVANNGTLKKMLTARRIACDQLNAAYSRRACQKVVGGLFVKLTDEFGDAPGVEVAIAVGRGGQSGGGGGDAERAADQLARQAAPDWRTAFCAKCDFLEQRYKNVAVGPAKEEAIGRLLVTRAAATSSDLMARVASAEKRAVRKLQAELAHASEKLEGLRGKLAAEKDAAAKELASTVRATEDAQRAADRSLKIETGKLEMKRNELERAQLEVKRLDGAYDFVLGRLFSMLQRDDEAAGALLEDYAELQENNIEHDTAMAGTSQSQPAHTVDENAMQIAKAGNDVELMQQHADLIHRNIEATKEVLAIKHSELQECEFQWGMAKARVAHEESEMMVLEEETSVLGSLVLKLKSHLQHRVTRTIPEEFTKQLDRRHLEFL
jgi:hypothetical protein